jgi:hypothetical protein
MNGSAEKSSSHRKIAVPLGLAAFLSFTYFLRGQFGAFNLGQLLGLRGLASLIPLHAFWAVAAIAWRGMNPGPARHI